MNWTIEGTHPAAGQYTNRTILEAIFVRIDATGSEERPLILTLTNVIGGGDEEWSVQELEVLGYCKNGSLYPSSLWLNVYRRICELQVC